MRKIDTEHAQKDKEKAEARKKAAEDRIKWWSDPDEPFEQWSISIGGQGWPTITYQEQKNPAGEIAKAEAELKLAKEALAVAEKALDDAKATESTAQEELDALIAEQEAAWKEYEKALKQGAENCPPDILDCGGNDCTAMTEAASRTMDCVTKALAQVRQSGGLTPVPGDIDPSPLDDPSDSSWARCFEYLGPPSVSVDCWWTYCPPGMLVTDEEGCRCVGQNVPGAAVLQPLCNELDCEEGTNPVVRHGVCTCRPIDEVPGLGGPGPSPFQLGLPPTFMEMRLTDVFTAYETGRSLRQIDGALLQEDT